MSYSKQTDQKWQKIWKETGLYKFDREHLDNKFYALEMFSYPSGAKLHLGHWFNFAPADSYARFKSMNGYNVFHPMGFDAFGLPAENYAIKTGIHPQDSTIKNIETMKKQLQEMGASYDWDYTVETCMPDYYKWTQWIFEQLYKGGLAYKKEAPVNWCSSCNTVLANEQVKEGECERCGTVVEQKKLSQWFFKTTAYAQELLDDLEGLDWPELTKKIQRNWIGRSEGAEVKFQLNGSEKELTVYTTRPDTLFGVTFMVVAPESDMVEQLTTKEQKEKVEAYRKEAAKSSEIERMAVGREKTGCFTGSYAIHPLTGEKVPIWVSDYVLEGYGTGCIMAVPAHDPRDYEFAKKFNLPIKQVIKPMKGNSNLEKEALTEVENGILIQSNFLNDLPVKEAQEKIIQYIEEKKIGQKKINYKLKDWLVSRQRYWGSPIPIIYCDDCGPVLVPQEDLPVLLPYDVEFRPDGESPLKKSEEFMHCKCPNCGKEALREADTLDTFVCSSWYFLRYPDAKNTEEAFRKEIIDKLLPVDIYVGGKEHAAMHLIYARFMTKALRDLGYLSFDEPFQKLVHQGMILGPDGNKMSKSKGNTVSPDEYIEKYGSDVFRLYLMFGFSYTEGGPWNDDGIKAIHKFLTRIETAVLNLQAKEYKEKAQIETKEQSLLFAREYCIKKMTEDIEKLQFNTAIARAMELLNEIVRYQNTNCIHVELLTETIKILIILLAPLAPHFTEEMWRTLGEATSVHKQAWPTYDEKALIQDEIEIPVQVNGKVKAVVKVPNNATKEQVKEIITKAEPIQKLLETNTIQKEIYVPGKIYNIVVKVK